MIHIPAAVREELDAIYAELPEEETDEEAYKTAFAAAIERRNLPAWMHDLLKESGAVESGLVARFLRAQRDSRERYVGMQAFTRDRRTPTRVPPGLPTRRLVPADGSAGLGDSALRCGWSQRSYR